MAKLDTPMMKQYMAIKEQYPDTVLLFRMGDFYEMFFEDAETASRELGLALTSRDKGKEDPVPLCGMPYHAVNRYLKVLLDRGYKVAICEQVEDPRKAKGIVRREVTRVVTPGTNLEEDPDDESIDHFLAAALSDGDDLGLAALDLGTGEFRAMQLSSPDALADEAAKLWPEELVLCIEAKEDPRFKPLMERLRDRHITFENGGEFPGYERSVKLLESRLEVSTLSGFGLDGLKAATKAAAAVLVYAEKNQKGDVGHLDTISVPTRQDHMVLDQVTVANLELVQGLESGTKSGSLLGVLDKTKTPMGGRRLREWLLFPSRNMDEVTERHGAVQVLLEDTILRADLAGHLSSIRDLDRLNAKIQLKRANARDMVTLADSLSCVADLKARLQSPVPGSSLLADISARLDPLQDLSQSIKKALVDAPPILTTEGGMFRQGFDPELDELIDIMEHGKDRILEIETRERARTGISSLKVKYNKVFGYFIEVTKANLASVPDDYVRKQTLANAERFVTQDLKEYEEKILTAEEKRKDLEKELFEELLATASLAKARLKNTARALSVLDALLSLAETAAQNNYCRPKMTQGLGLQLVDSRHPVVEVTMPQGERFVPNDLELDGETTTMLIVTGPNMAGKSTVMRQAALACIMAQAGSFVPARSAVLPMVDRVFTRIGASDQLSMGKSTFMVEMSETANILNNATKDSLVLLDEIGRGTSTYDGLSIAWAVAEYLHDQIGCKTLFATHYHELVGLAAKKERIQNVNIAVKEWKGSIVFLRKLLPGATNKSYGVQVARLAGLPGSVVKRAAEILANLEKGVLDEVGAPVFAKTTVARKGEHDNKQLSLFGVTATKPSKVEQELVSIDTDTVTPIEALNMLYRLKSMLQEEGRGNSAD